MRRIISIAHLAAFLLALLLIYEPPKKESVKIIYITRYIEPEVRQLKPIEKKPLPAYNPVINKVSEEIYSKMEQIQLEATDIKYESLGYYYITAYCDCEKCCYPSTGMTASGTYTHYASWNNRLTEPTTCAIDRKLHRFGENIYIPSQDRIYVTEDTGSAVRGRHIDIYFPDHSYVRSYGSHWEEVYKVTYSSHLECALDYDVRRIYFDNLLNL